MTVPRIKLRYAKAEYAVVLAHPIDGKLPAPPESGDWQLDSFTRRLLAQGAVVEVTDEEAMPPPDDPAPPPAKPDKRSK